jgi:hypothetical protein
MIPQFELLIIMAIIICIILLLIGYLIGIETQNYAHSVLPKSGIIEKAAQKVKESVVKQPEIYVEPGIVYRPTAEELEIMNEPQKVKDAKEAVAETLAKEMPPVI